MLEWRFIEQRIDKLFMNKILRHRLSLLSISLVRNIFLKSLLTELVLPTLFSLPAFHIMF